MREYNIVIEQILDIKEADLSNNLAIAEQWNKLTVADYNPEFLDECNRVISDVSITNG